MARLTEGERGRSKGERGREGEASSLVHRAETVSPSSTCAHISSTAAFTTASIDRNRAIQCPPPSPPPSNRN